MTFIAKDYCDRAIKKPVTLNGVEFLRRFTLHVLPARFVKIRYFGIYNHTTKKKQGLQFVVVKKPDIERLGKDMDLPRPACNDLNGLQVMILVCARYAGRGGWL